jgi:hypothetical protein
MSIERSYDYATTWSNRGEFFGYPSCCINEFIRTKGLKLRDSSKLRSTIGNFIPCEMHQEQLQRGEVILEDLIQNRTCETEFPHGDFPQCHHDRESKCPNLHLRSCTLEKSIGIDSSRGLILTILMIQVALYATCYLRH